MKKGIVFLSAVGLVAASCNPKVYNTSTEARQLEMPTAGYGKPLTAELKVTPLRKKSTFIMTAQEYMRLGNVTQVRNRALSLASEEWKCDVVVAPTVNIRSVNEGEAEWSQHVAEFQKESSMTEYGYIIDVKGFAGEYANWSTLQDADLKWLKLEKGIQDVIVK